MTGDTVDIRIRAADAQAVAAFRRLKQEATHSLGSLAALATSAVPVMATLGAASVKTAGSAVGATGGIMAFGLAVAGQIPNLSKVSDAQKKYREAVQQSGRGSKEAAEAQRTLSNALASMPASTARAAVGLRTMKDDFRDWSDSLADFTMTPVEKTFTVLSNVFPKLTPMARGASEQLDRLVTVAGGAVASPGFDALSERMGAFTTGSLDKAIDGLLHLSRALSEGEASGPVKAFMDYAERNGPAVRETLSSLGDAVTTLVEAAADAGPGMLTLVNAAAGLVAALPPELVTILMQTAVGLKLVTLAGAGAAAASTAVAALGTRIGVMRGAAVAAGGGLLGLRAAFLSLGTAAKASVVVGGIALVAVALNEISQIGKEAPPNVERMTTSLGRLAQSGKLSGEAARVFGEDYEKLGESLRTLSRPSNLDKTQQFLTSLVGMDSTPVKDAKEDFNALDESLTDLVKGGKAELATAALELSIKSLKEQGFTAGEVKGQLDDYKAALADQAFEQELAAQSMGIFGQAAQETSAKLGAQKESADGLRASILALNDVNRSAYDAQIGFEQSLDDLTASFKEHGATLDLDTEAGRANGMAMSSVAKAHDEMIASGLAAGDSLGSMTKESDELRETMMRLATDGFKGNTEKAREYVNELLGVPGDIETLVKLEREEAITGLKDVQAEIDKTPGKKSVTVDTLNGAAIAALEKVGLKTKQLPDGQTQVFTANGKALGNIGAVFTALSNLNGKTANTYTTNNVKTVYSELSVPRRFGEIPEADGGVLEFYANGGTREQHVAQMAPAGTMRVWAEPETGGEAYIPLALSKRDRSVAVLEETADRFGYGLEKFARGGVTKKEREARNAARGELTISHFGQMAGFKNPEIRNQIGDPGSVMDLVKSLNKWRSVIKKTTHGAEESRLLRWLNNTGKALIGQEKKLLKVNKALDKATSKLDTLKDSASRLSGSVKSGILSGANITKAAGAEDSQVTINTLLSQMQGSAASSKQFSSMLTSLKKKGLSGGLIAQIGEAGIEGGGMETAAAILGGGTAEIKKLNDLQKQITSAAGTAGKVTADAMYGAGIKAAEGLVKGLTSQQKVIEAGMMRIAKSMEKGIKKALKIKSPSQVMETIGGQTAEGFALGIQRNRSVQPAWASMLNVPRGGGPRPGAAAGAAASSGWGDRPLAITLQIGNGQLGEVIIDPVRKAVSTRGGLRATFGGLD
jgi:hypothetical protein